jgi:hypothetical protein
LGQTILDGRFPTPIVPGLGVVQQRHLREDRQHHFQLLQTQTLPDHRETRPRYVKDTTRLRPNFQLLAAISIHREGSGVCRLRGQGLYGLRGGRKHKYEPFSI